MLIGIVAVASVGILAVGGNIQEDAKEQVDRERVRQTFRQLGKEIDSVARSNADNRQVEFELPSASDSAIRREDAGQIVIERQNVTTTKTIVVQSIGSLVYDEDGTHYAYQAGAVWSGEGNETQLVSAPNIVYATTPDGGSPTLTMPITNLQGPDKINTGGLELRNMRTVAPINNVSTVQNQLVTLHITSDYYVGWGKYFENRYEKVVVSYDHPNETTTIKLGSTDIPGTWDVAIGADGDVTDSSSGSISGEVETGGDYNGDYPYCDTDGDGTQEQSSDCVTESSSYDAPVLDTAIASKTESILESCADGESGFECHPGKGLQDVTSPGADLQGGTTYYFGQDSLLTGGGTSGTIQADLSTGNVTVVLDGDLGITQGGSEIEATNPNQGPNCCYLRIYFNGTDMSMSQKAGLYAEGKNATHVQVYGTSDFHLDAKNIQNGNGWHAALYAPGQSGNPLDNDANSLDSQLGVGCSYDICFGQGSGTVDGAVVAGSVTIDQSASLDYEEALASTDRSLGQAGVVPPPITFLHVSVSKVCVGEGTCSGNAGGGGGGGGTNAAPVAAITYSPTNPNTGETVTFDAANSADSDGSIASFEWDLDGDGNYDDATGPTASRSYSSTGTYTVGVRVTDDDGATSTTTTTVTVTSSLNHPPSASFTYSPSSPSTGDTVDFDASASYDPDGPGVSYAWDLDGDGNYDDATGAMPSTSFSSGGDHTVSVQVTDSDGATDTETKTITVTAPPTFSSVDVVDDSQTTGSNQYSEHTASWSVDDPTGPPDFDHVEVVFEEYDKHGTLENTRTRTFGTTSGSDTYNKPGNKKGSIDVTIRIYDQSGNVVACKTSGKDAIDGSDPALSDC